MSQVSTLLANADARTWSMHPTTNYGDAAFVNMGEYSDGTNCQGYIGFDLTEIPAHARITSATLALLQYDSPDDWQTPVVTMAAKLCGAAWTEMEVTHGNAPSDHAASPTALHSVQGEDTWHSWDVTAHLQAIMAGSIPWNGFHLYYTGTSGSTMKYFRSRDYGAQYAPQLSITWDYPFPKLQVGAAWRQISDAWVNVGGVWRHVTEIQLNVGGSWRLLG